MIGEQQVDWSIDFQARPHSNASHASLIAHHLGLCWLLEVFALKLLELYKIQDANMENIIKTNLFNDLEIV